MYTAQREALTDPLVVIPQWKRVLYYIQLQAPKPRKVECAVVVPHRPPYYGSEFHGMITRHKADDLLSAQDGCYLVRESMRTPGSYTLAIRFQSNTKNYRLFYSAGQHHVGDKCFESLDDLVADGLICFHVHLKAPEYIASMAEESHYAESPYMRYREQAQRIDRQAAPAVTARRTSTSSLSSPMSVASPLSAHRISLQTNGSIYRPQMTDEIFDFSDGPTSQSSAKQVGEWMDIMQSEKPHNFKLTTFKSINSSWCEFCLHFMWGLIQQGVECQDCGFRAHKKCSEKVPNDCMPCMKKLKRMFSLDLTTLLKATNKSLPVVVEKCVREIESRGLEEEGLYRVAGFHDDIEAIRSAFDIEGDADVSVARYKDINTITSVLKLFFRLLPLPLITDEVYPKCISLVTTADDLPQREKLRRVREAIQSLPPAHYQTLKYLIAHLNRVTQFKDKNMMTAVNLAMVFAPTLLQSPQQTDPIQGMAVVRLEQKVVDLLISNYEAVFER